MSLEEEAKASDLNAKGMNSWKGSARSKIKVAYGSTSILTFIFPTRPTHFFPTETRHVYNEHLLIIVSPRSSMGEVILSRPPSVRGRQANKGAYGSVPRIRNSASMPLGSNFLHNSRYSCDFEHALHDLPIDPPMFEPWEGRIEESLIGE